MPDTTEPPGTTRRDGAAFAALFEREAHVLYSWAASRLTRRERPLAEDLLQEVWLRALNRFEEFEGGEARFRAWLFGIAHNARLELMRELARGSGGGASGVFELDRVPVEATSISSRIARDEELQLFLDRIAKLAPDDLELLELHGFQGLAWAEIGGELGIGEEAARQRYSRLLSRLRKEGVPRWVNDG